MTMPDRSASPPARARAAVEFRDAILRDRGVTLLAGLTFEVPNARTARIAAPSDMASTAIAEACLGLRPLEGGAIRLLGMDPTAAVAAGRVGAVLRPDGLPDSISVRELLRFAIRAHTAPIGLADLVDRAHLELVVNGAIGKLSPRQRVQLRLALALAGDPDLIVLDASTVGGDRDQDSDLLPTIERLNGEGRAVLLMSAAADESAGGSGRSSSLIELLVAHPLGTPWPADLWP